MPVVLRVSLFLSLWLIRLHGLGQNRAWISGVVSGEGRPLAAAVISAGRFTTTTDSNGRYRLGPLPPRKQTIRISYVGHETVEKILSTDAQVATTLNITLAVKGELLGEMLVTGVSKATRTRETPLSVSLVSSKTIAREMEPNLIDALAKNVPGLDVVKTGPNISKPFIRGLGYNRVLTLYDGFRQEGQQWGDEHGIEVDAYNVDKAEVIKGPASLMFGSDALAGVVSLFPWLPKTGETGIQGRVVSEFQSNNGLIGNGLRIGSVSGRWLWAASGSYRMAKNYSDPVDGRVYNTGFRETNAAATLGYKAEKGYSRLSATVYDNLQGIPDGSRDSLTRRFTYQAAEGAEDDILHRPLVPATMLNGYALSPLHQHIQHYRLYNINHYKAGPGELETMAGFQQSVRREYSHPTDPAQAGLYVRLNTINYGIRYVLSSGNWEWTAGANGMLQQNSSRVATDFPIPDYRLWDIGPYLHAKWKKDNWIFTGGLRYDTRSLKGSDFYVSRNPFTGFFQQASPTDDNSELQYARFNKTFRGVSLSTGVAYALSPLITIKANVARGYRSPNITEYAANGLDPGAHIIYLGNRNTEPEFSFQQDLGVHFYFPSLTAYFSGFSNHISNYIYLAQRVNADGSPQTDAQGNRSFAYEQASAKLYGAEFSADWHPAALKGFHFISSGTLIRGFNLGSDFRNKGSEGEYLPLIPPARWVNSVSEEITLERSIFSGVSGKLEWEYNAAQNRYLALYHTETATPAYGLLNCSLGTTIRYYKDKKMQVLFQVNNTLNRAYQNHLSRLKYFEYFSASPNGRSGIYNMGRNACIKLITDL